MLRWFFALAALIPPQPFVPGPAGERQTLEQAGILKPDGRRWALALGKALFWDQHTGSDGLACASCHFSAGADSRIANQLNPGLLRQPAADQSFGSITELDGELVPGAPGVTRSGGVPDSTYVLKPGDFPFHNTSDKRDRNAPLVITTNDSMSSAGAFDRAFALMRGASGTEGCGEARATVFHAGSLAARQVEPRNTPTTINAVFNHRNFWDGRANNMFNGVGVFGPRDLAGNPNARLIILQGGAPVLGSVDVRNASLASQAVGPPLSAAEMSCGGRSFAELGRRMLSPTARPLELQRIHPDDSVLGPLAHRSGLGLDRQYGYSALIERAFGEKYWAAAGTFRIVDGALQQVSEGEHGGGAGYTQKELNFSLFWGIAIMLYEATLVSDQSPFDSWLAACSPRVTNPGDPNAVPIANPFVQCTTLDPITNRPVPLPDVDPAALVPGFGPAEVLGFGLFTGGGVPVRNAGSPFCSGCHNLPLFSEAAFQDGTTFVPVERTRIDDRGAGTPNIPIPTLLQRVGGQRSTVEGAVHDRGFFNVGSRATRFDLGIGGLDPYGNPLSLARSFVNERRGLPVVDPSGVLDPCNTPALIEGGFPSLAQAPEVNQGRYPGCDGSLATTTDSVDPAFDWSLERELVDGTVKTPTMRNVALTPPYFHYGGYAELRSVVEFYARGGNHRDKSHVDAGYTGDTTGTGPLGKGPVPYGGPAFGSNVDFFVRDLKSTDEQIDAMVAFMKALTDPRVQCDAAPFDHPELLVPNGHRSVDANHDGRADDVIAVIPAVGTGGYSADGRGGLCLPNSGNLFDPALRNRLVAP